MPVADSTMMQGFRPLLVDADYEKLFSRLDDRCGYKKCRKKAAVFPVLLFYYKNTTQEKPCGKVVIDLALCHYCGPEVKVSELTELLEGWFEILAPWRDNPNVKKFPEPALTRKVLYHLRPRQESDAKPSLDDVLEIGRKKRMKL